jgi:hypothetical protein
MPITIQRTGGAAAAGLAAGLNQALAMEIKDKQQREMEEFTANLNLESEKQRLAMKESFDIQAEARAYQYEMDKMQRASEIKEQYENNRMMKELGEINSRRDALKKHFEKYPQDAGNPELAAQMEAYNNAELEIITYGTYRPSTRQTGVNWGQLIGQAGAAGAQPEPGAQPEQRIVVASPEGKQEIISKEEFLNKPEYKKHTLVSKEVPTVLMKDRLGKLYKVPVDKVQEAITNTGATLAEAMPMGWKSPAYQKAHKEWLNEEYTRLSKEENYGMTWPWESSIPLPAPESIQKQTGKGNK